MDIIIILVLLVLAMGVAYSAYKLYLKSVEIQKQLIQVEDQVDRIRRHLELEHLAALSDRARAKGLIGPEGEDKALRALHEMEMDNWQGKK